MSAVDILLRLALGLVIGFCIGLTGVGGGVLVVPSLTLFLGLPASIAVGTASLFACLTRMFGTFSHFRLKTIDFSIAFLFLAGALPGSVIVSCFINRRVSDMETDPQALGLFQDDLKTFIALVILVSAGVLIINLIRKLKKELGTTERNIGEGLKVHKVLKCYIGIFVGLIAGAVIGATSIGGGVLIIPILIILFRMSVSRTVGTSIFITAVLALVMSIIYGQNSQIDSITAVIMAAGSLFGVHWGSKLVVKLPDNKLQGVVIVVVIVAVVMMLVD